MRFQLPQFIERETKILGPFSFKQFIFVGVAGVIIFILYFSLAKTNFLVFAFVTLMLAVAALALAFARVDGKTLPEVLTNSFFFLTSSRIYLWKRKSVTPRLIKLDKKPKKEEATEEPVLKIKGKGRLEKLASQIETNTR